MNSLGQIELRSIRFERIMSVARQRWWQPVTTHDFLRVVRTKVVLPFLVFEWKMTPAGDGAAAGQGSQWRIA
jgi:hypothetical protein